MALRRRLLLILFFFGRLHCEAWQSDVDIDSLLKVISSLSKNYPDSAILLGAPFEEVLLKNSRTNSLAHLYKQMSTAYNQKADYPKAIEYGQKSIQLYKAEGDSLGVSRNLLFLGSIHRYLGNRELAMEYYLRSLDIRNTYGSETDQALALYGIGNYYYETKEFEKCEEYYHKALSIFEHTNDTSRLADMYYNFGNLFLVKLQYDSSLLFYTKSFECYKSIGDVYMFPRLWSTTGQVFLRMKNIEKAEYYFFKAEKGFEEFEDKLNRCHNLSLLSRLEYDRKNYQAALNYAEIMRSVATEINAISYIIDSYKLLSNTYHGLGQYKEAYSNRSWEKYYSDSLYSSEKQKTVRELTIKYETELKEKEIAKLTSEKKAQEQEVLLATSEKNAYRVGIVLAVALAIAVSAFFAQRQKASHLRSMQALTERNVRIDALLKEQEVSSLNALIEGQEKERMRIAEELHDRLGSMLSAIKLNFIGSTVKKDVEQKSTENETVRTSQMLEEAVTEVRRISHNLSTGQVSRYGLVSSMDDLAARINQSDSVAMKVMHFNLEERLPVEMETGIYRITQEMLANVLKHAQASEFIVQLNKTENSVILTAEDDGIGFDYKEARRKGGIGLQNIENRVKKFGGQFSVDTAPGKGAIFTFEFPLEA